MMETKHTPGPWKADGVRIIGGKVSVATVLNVAWPYGEKPTSPEDNARLIAAAPELLEALKKAVDYIAPRVSGTGGKGESLLPMLNAAIAKATWSAQ